MIRSLPGHLGTQAKAPAFHISLLGRYSMSQEKSPALSRAFLADGETNYIFPVILKAMIRA
jgi:hypothetical protein